MSETTQRVAGVPEVRTRRVVEVFGRKDVEDDVEDFNSEISEYKGDQK